MQIKKLLDELGLGKSKGEVYLAALATGTATAQQIATQARLPRTTAHEILSQLTMTGVVSYTTRGRTRRYTAESPEQLIRLLEEKKHRLEQALPDFLALYNTAGARPRVRMYEGVEGIKTVFYDTLLAKNKQLRGILSMADLYDVPGKTFMDHYIRDRIAAGIQLRVIRSEQKEVEENWSSSRRELRETHYAPRDMIFPMTIYIYDNKVGIIGTERENFGMIIESSDFHQTLKNLFEVLWQVTRVAKGVD